MMAETEIGIIALMPAPRPSGAALGPLLGEGSQRAPIDR
jgi:hypothetical protein